MKLELTKRFKRFFDTPFSRHLYEFDPKTGIIKGVSNFSFDEFNICQFRDCLRQGPNELSVWPCQFCGRDFPVRYWFRVDFIPVDLMPEIKRINGPGVFDRSHEGSMMRMIEEDKSSDSGAGPCDKKQGEFKKGLHTGSPCDVPLIQYWAQTLNES